MSATLDREVEKKSFITADLAAAAEIPIARQAAERDSKRDESQNSDVRSEDQQLAALFSPDRAKEFRSHWDAVQRSFVDDPRQAVRQADELVAQVMNSLAETFSNERRKLEREVDQTDKASTETLRVALRRYRSFFERLLAL
jgi:hypothetical protein